jgi:hypothetical protein
MNKIEDRMVTILKELKDTHGAISVRAEFEAEGTRLDELLRLKEICMAAGVGLTLKIGGCESIRDMLEARVVGVNYIVAPMVESPYALRKYLQAIDKVFPPDERSAIEVLCNIETATACSRFDEMLLVPEIRTLDGVVIERVDLSFSLGLDEHAINNEEVNSLVLGVLTKAKAANLKCTVGGGVSAQSLPFFQSIPKGYLDRYETRKVCFAWNETANGHDKAILKALGFEVFWLRDKLDYYKVISQSDMRRMNLIEQRYWNAINALV